MSDVVKLVTEPSASEKTRQEIVDILEQALVETRAGRFTCLFLIAQLADGQYLYDRSTVADVQRLIGQLEVLKLKIAGAYIDQHTSTC